jgi:hypothetical protein
MGEALGLSRLRGPWRRQRQGDVCKVGSAGEILWAQALLRASALRVPCWGGSGGMGPCCWYPLSWSWGLCQSMDSLLDNSSLMLLMSLMSVDVADVADVAGDSPWGAWYSLLRVGAIPPGGLQGGPAGGSRPPGPCWDTAGSLLALLSCGVPVRVCCPCPCGGYCCTCFNKYRQTKPASHQTEGRGEEMSRP